MRSLWIAPILLELVGPASAAPFPAAPPAQEGPQDWTVLTFRNGAPFAGDEKGGIDNARAARSVMEAQVRKVMPAERVGAWLSGVSLSVNPTAHYMEWFIPVNVKTYIRITYQNHARDLPRDW